MKSVSIPASSPDLELRYRLDAIYQAHADASFQEPGTVPSLSECRDLLRLYVRLGNEDLRQAVLCALRTIVGAEH